VGHGPETEIRAGHHRTPYGDHCRLKMPQKSFDNIATGKPNSYDLVSSTFVTARGAIAFRVSYRRIAKAQMQ
jgi:hypothetical protein